MRDFSCLFCNKGGGRSAVENGNGGGRRKALLRIFKGLGLPSHSFEEMAREGNLKLCSDCVDRVKEVETVLKQYEDVCRKYEMMREKYELILDSHAQEIGKLVEVNAVNKGDNSSAWDRFRKPVAEKVKNGEIYTPRVSLKRDASLDLRGRAEGRRVIDEEGESSQRSSAGISRTAGKRPEFNFDDGKRKNHLPVKAKRNTEEQLGTPLKSSLSPRKDGAGAKSLASMFKIRIAPAPAGKKKYQRHAEDCECAHCKRKRANNNNISAKRRGGKGSPTTGRALLSLDNVNVKHDDICDCIQCSAEKEKKKTPIRKGRGRKKKAGTAVANVAHDKTCYCMECSAKKTSRKKNYGRGRGANAARSPKTTAGRVGMWTPSKLKRKAEDYQLKNGSARKRMKLAANDDDDDEESLFIPLMSSSRIKVEKDMSVLTSKAFKSPGRGCFNDSDEDNSSLFRVRIRKKEKKAKKNEEEDRAAPIAVNGLNKTGDHPNKPEDGNQKNLHMKLERLTVQARSTDEAGVEEEESSTTGGDEDDEEGVIPGIPDYDDDDVDEAIELWITTLEPDPRLPQEEKMQKAFEIYRELQNVHRETTKLPFDLPRGLDQPQKTDPQELERQQKEALRFMSETEKAECDNLTDPRY